MTEATRNEDIVIDPVAMKIVNRIAPGTKQSGTIDCAGGLMIEGEFIGTINVVGGPFVLMPEARVCGVINCDQDAYLFGSILARDDGELSELTAHGAVFLTETVNAKANITAGAFKTYEGSEVEGKIKTIRRS